MKHIALNIFFALVVVCATSCSNEDDPKPSPPPPVSRGYYIIDGAKLENIQLSHKLSEYKKGYGDLQLFINLSRKSTYNQFEPVAEIETAYFIDRYAFVLDSCKSYRTQHPGERIENPFFFSAYVDGEVTITCDKKLFGKEPGEVLNEFFTLDRGVYNPVRCHVVGIEDPHFLYAIESESPISMNQVFTDASWLLKQSYVWYFPENPPEKYNRITFRLTFPVLIEHSWDWAESVYEGGEDKKIYSKKVFTSECTVKFIW